MPDSMIENTKSGKISNRMPNKTPEYMCHTLSDKM